MGSMTKRSLLICVVSILLTIEICNYMYKNSSREQIIIVLSGLMASISYMAIHEIYDKIDQCRKK